MLAQLHANATTTTKVWAEIQASSGPVSVLATRCGVSETTMRRWRVTFSLLTPRSLREPLGLIAGLRRRR